MSKNFKQLALVLLVVLLGVMIYKLEFDKKTEVKELNYSQFLALVDAGVVKEVTIEEIKHV